jgi:hypothetical protein
MWGCEQCGTQGIAGSLTFCPQCFSPRPEPPAGTTIASEEEKASADGDLTQSSSPGPADDPQTPSKSDWGVKKRG